MNKNNFSDFVVHLYVRFKKLRYAIKIGYFANKALFLKYLFLTLAIGTLSIASLFYIYTIFRK